LRGPKPRSGFGLAEFALRVNIRDGAVAVKKSVYSALAVRPDGQKELLRLVRIEQNEGEEFWMGVMNELKNRGVKDIFLATVDGLTWFPGAVDRVPQNRGAALHAPYGRNSVRFVPYKDHKAVIAGQTVHKRNTSSLTTLGGFSIPTLYWFYHAL
jgi:transposase-like protein